MGAGDAAYRTGRTFHEPRPVDTVPFGCFRRATWESLGGFNERVLTNEDYEFNYRVRQSGRNVVLDPRIRSTYYARSTLPALAEQYFRYGWWKAQMLKVHPKSLRWRQAVPAAFVATIAALVVLVVVLVLAGTPTLAAVAGAGLAALLLVYLGGLLFAAQQISGGRRSWSLLPVLPLAFAPIAALAAVWMERRGISPADFALNHPAGALGTIRKRPETDAAQTVVPGIRASLHCLPAGPSAPR